MSLEEEKISRIKVLLKHHTKGLTISEIAAQLKMNRNSLAKYLEILLISGQVETRTYGTARVFFLSHRVPISAMLSVSRDIVLVLDENHKVTFVNDNFLDFFTLKRGDVAGRHIVDIFCKGIRNPDLPEIFSDLIINNDLVKDVKLEKDGGLFFFKVKSIETVFDNGSKGATIVMEEVTSERKYQMELEAKEARYRGIVEDQTEFITRFRPDGALTFVNTSYARYLGKKPDDLIGEPHIVNLADEDKKTVEHALLSLSRESSVTTFECRVHCPAGIRWQHWTIRAFFGSGEKLLEYQGVGRDSTEKREAAAKINQYIRDMEFLSQKALDFIDLPADTDIYEPIAAGFSSIVPGALLTCVSSFDKQARILTLRSAWARDDLRVITRMEGRQIDMSVMENEKYYALMISGKLVRIPLDDFVNNVDGKLVVEEMQRATDPGFEIGEMCGIGFTHSGEILGAALLILSKEAIPFNISLVEAYSREASIALQKWIAEKKLRESEQKYRLLADNATDTIWIIDLATGKFTYFSPAVEKIRGFTPEEAVEIPLEKTLTPESYARAMAELKNTLELDKQGLVEHGRIRVFEFEQYRKDGSIIFTETGIRLLRNAEGIPTHLQGITRDITERRKAENVLKESEARFRTLFMISPDGIILFDLTGRITFASPEALRMFRVPTLDEATGTSVFDWVDPEYHGLVRNAMVQLLDGNVLREITYRVRRRDGSTFFAETGQGVFPDADGRPNGFMVIIRDVTERKRPEEALRESRQL